MSRTIEIARITMARLSDKDEAEFVCHSPDSKEFLLSLRPEAAHIAMYQLSEFLAELAIRNPSLAVVLPVERLAYSLVKHSDQARLFVDIANGPKMAFDLNTQALAEFGRQIVATLPATPAGKTTN